MFAGARAVVELIATILNSASPYHILYSDYVECSVSCLLQSPGGDNYYNTPWMFHSPGDAIIINTYICFIHQTAWPSLPPTSSTSAILWWSLSLPVYGGSWRTSALVTITWWRHETLYAWRHLSVWWSSWEGNEEWLYAHLGSPATTASNTVPLNLTSSTWCDVINLTSSTWCDVINLMWCHQPDVMSSKWCDVINLMWCHQRDMTSSTWCDVVNLMWRNKPDVTSSTWCDVINLMWRYQPAVASSTWCDVINLLWRHQPDVTSSTWYDVINLMWRNQPNVTSSTLWRHLGSPATPTTNTVPLSLTPSICCDVISLIWRHHLMWRHQPDVASSAWCGVINLMWRHQTDVCYQPDVTSSSWCDVIIVMWRHQQDVTSSGKPHTHCHMMKASHDLQFDVIGTPCQPGIKR